MNSGFESKLKWTRRETAAIFIPQCKLMQNRPTVATENSVQSMGGVISQPNRKPQAVCGSAPVGRTKFAYARFRKGAQFEHKSQSGFFRQPVVRNGDAVR